MLHLHTRIHLPYTVRTRETCVSVRCAVTLYMTILQVAKREKRMKYTHSRESMNQSVLAILLFSRPFPCRRSRPDNANHGHMLKTPNGEPVM